MVEGEDWVGKYACLCEWILCCCWCCVLEVVGWEAGWVEEDLEGCETEEGECVGGCRHGDDCVYSVAFYFNVYRQISIHGCIACERRVLILNLFFVYTII